MPTRFRARSLVLVVLLTAATAMVYQFSVVSALIFIMGDSILLFSVFTGVFLLSMGVGSVLGARPTAAMDISFIRVQFSLAALGLAALPLVFCLFAASEYARRRGITLPQPAVVFTFWANGLLIDFLFGVLTGMQLPLLAGLFRTLRLQDRSLASLLGFDYLGSFVGALAFPLFLFPSLGLFRTVFLASLINTTTALLSSALLEQRRSRSIWTAAVLAALALVAFLTSHTLEHAVDYFVYGDR